MTRTVTVELDAETAALAEQLVAEGAFGSVPAVVESAVTEWLAAREDEEIQAAIQVGVRDFDEGRAAEVTLEEIVQEGERRSRGAIRSG